MAFDWKKTIATIAPTIATALGGPLAGMAVNIAAEALGVEGESEDTKASTIANLVASGNPEVLLKLKTAEHNLKSKLKELDVDLERIHAGDRDSAREMQKDTKSKAPGRLAAVVFIGFFGILIGLMVWGDQIAKQALTPLNIMLGSLATLVIQVANYFFGSSKGSSEKNTTIAKLMRR